MIPLQPHKQKPEWSPIPVFYLQKAGTVYGSV